MKKETICPECQFEKGHSRACKYFKEPKSPQPKAPQEKWIKEFDKKFPDTEGYEVNYDKTAIKQFIKDLLAQNTEQGIKEIEDAIDDLPRICGKEDNHEYIDTCKIYKILTKLRDRK